MAATMGERAVLGASVEGATLVIGRGGRASELVRSALGGEVVTLAPTDARTLPAGVCLVVLDATSARVDELATARATLASAPALLLLPADGPEPTPLPADDVLRLPAPEATLERRLRTLRELGRVQHDVTALTEARAELDVLYRLVGEQRTLDPAVLDSLDAGVLTASAEGDVRTANRAAAELLQVAPAALIARPVHTVLGLDAPLDALLGTDARRVVPCELTRADGSRVEVEASVSRVGPSASTASFFLVLRDRTRDRQLEMERQRLERLAAIGTMVAGFAHEVRNPVASLRSLTESLAEELTQRDLPLPHLTRMLRALERIERLVRTSLQFGRPDTPRRAPHRPWTLLGLATEAVSARTKELGGDIRVEVVPDLPNVYVDETQLVQVLVVLLNNALDATGASGKVRARARGGELDPTARRSVAPGVVDAVRFEIVDDGPGIRADDLERIFDPFFTTKSEGTGLGLSIAQQLVSENGGRLEVASPRGGPTIFAVTLPTDRRPPRTRPPRAGFG